MINRTFGGGGDPDALEAIETPHSATKDRIAVALFQPCRTPFPPGFFDHTERARQIALAHLTDTMPSKRTRNQVNTSPTDHHGDQPECSARKRSSPDSHHFQPPPGPSGILIETGHSNHNRFVGNTIAGEVTTVTLVSDHSVSDRRVTNKKKWHPPPVASEVFPAPDGFKASRVPDESRTRAGQAVHRQLTPSSKTFVDHEQRHPESIR